ncbi:Yip1-domain-containing protein [Neocallimastix lanati (nom. inval.)]|jgi:hypothetical protein|uniref:Protein YIP n=1 Tax=Neocallimastix californiae TaxID=1754190 RepID=A0A1Y2BS43_9FUNG|nr:Yip1-domain-containing protein [Neocallimastix sp. JGI-2020a]ORY37544.1 Yip1-domain-containing protein [Neocallimastix californiae]|eukprot:ORY37544.1 Yip1-domain-containing protein [Neocallimastix californiae]
MDPNYSSILDLDIEQTPEEKAKNDLEFQNFVMSNDENIGKMNTNLNNNNLGSASFTTIDNNTSSDNYSIWNIEYYSKYFNVDTKDVIERIICTIFPKESFFNKVDANPDLYGPVWISTTVILTLFVTSCIANSLVTFLKDKKGDAKYNYDFSLLSFASVTVYTYIGVIPLVIWFLCKYFSISLGLIDLYCLYGYGLSLWIPAAVFAILPYSLLHTIFVLIPGIISGYYLYYNIYPYTKHCENKLASVVIFATIFTSLIILILIFKFFFFKFSV